jgi:hypothetical protein
MTTGAGASRRCCSSRTGASAAAASHPWYSVVKLDARSHFPMFEVPQEMSAEIERFIAPSRRPGLGAARAFSASWVNSLPL